MNEKRIPKHFNQFINELRIRKNIPMERLCEGLCTTRMAWYLERGERSPDKLLQDCILDRLGIGAEDYEYFLYHDEYNRWEARQHILHNITYENWARAELLLQKYRDFYNMKNPLEKQFYLSMLAQIWRHYGKTPESLHVVFTDAVLLTVPGLKKKPLAQLALSLKELNLILEAEFYRKDGPRPQQCQDIADYILSNGFDRQSVAKLYPKAVYYLCQAVLESPCPDSNEQWPDYRLLAYCTHALSSLQKCFRMYYLWEILNMRDILLTRMIENLTQRQECQKASNLMPMYQENAMFKQEVTKIYEKLHIPKQTWDYCYLYVVKGVSCINDVIRIRRKMLGISQTELCKNICDTATLRRLERRETVTHREITEELFQRLGLSTEFAKTNLVTASHDARLLMGKIRKQLNERKWDTVCVLQQQLKNLIAMDIPHNQQALMRQETLTHWHMHKITKKEYYAQLLTALELTLPYQSFCIQGEKYLTKEEQLCIMDMMDVMDETSAEYATCAQRFEELYHSYETNELLESVFSMYEIIMGNIGSWRGNRSDFNQSDQYNMNILTGCLRFRRSTMINRSLYGRWWNHNMQKKLGIPTTENLNSKDELMSCILFSRLNKQKYREQFLLKQLESLAEDE